MIIFSTSCPLYVLYPKLPCTSSLSQFQYCTMMGLFSPSFSWARSRASGEDRGLSMPPSGPPGAIFMMKKVRIVMPKTTGITCRRRLRIYLFISGPP